MPPISSELAYWGKTRTKLDHLGRERNFDHLGRERNFDRLGRERNFDRLGRERSTQDEQDISSGSRSTEAEPSGRLVEWHLQDYTNNDGQR